MAKNKRQEEARRILERVNQESETVGTSSMKRVADRVSGHLEGNADPNDNIEIWGTRIGRGLGLVFFIGLAIYLVKTYVLNG